MTTNFRFAVGRFLSIALCLLIPSVASGIAAEALKPIAGTVDILQNGGKTMTRSVSHGGSTYTLTFAMQARFSFHSLGGEPTRQFVTKMSLRSIDVSPPISYTDKGATVSAPASFSSGGSELGEYGAADVFRRIKLYKVGVRATFNPGGPGSATHSFADQEVFGSQGNWGSDVAGSPNWNRFLDGMPAEAAKEAYERLLRNGCSVRIEVDDIEFAGLSDFRGAVLNTLRDRAKAAAAAAMPAEDFAEGDSGAGGFEEAEDDEPKTEARENSPPARNTGNNRIWKGYAGPDRAQLDRNNRTVAEMLRRRREIMNRNQSRPSNAPSSGGRSRPGTAVQINDMDGGGGGGRSQPGAVVPINEMDRGSGARFNAGGGGRAGSGEKMRAGAGSLKEALEKAKKAEKEKKTLTRETMAKKREEAKRTVERETARKRENDGIREKASREAAERRERELAEAKRKRDEAAKKKADDEARRRQQAVAPAPTYAAPPSPPPARRQNPENHTCNLCGGEGIYPGRTHNYGGIMNTQYKYNEWGREIGELLCNGRETWWEDY